MPLAFGYRNAMICNPSQVFALGLNVQIVILWSDVQSRPLYLNNDDQVWTVPEVVNREASIIVAISPRYGASQTSIYCFMHEYTVVGCLTMLFVLPAAPQLFIELQ